MVRDVHGDRFGCDVFALPLSARDFRRCRAADFSVAPEFQYLDSLLFARLLFRFVVLDAVADLHAAEDMAGNSRQHVRPQHSSFDCSACAGYVFGNGKPNRGIVSRMISRRTLLMGSLLAPLAQLTTRAQSGSGGKMVLSIHQNTSRGAGYRKSLEGWAKAGIKYVELTDTMLDEFLRTDTLAAAKS